MTETYKGNNMQLTYDGTSWSIGNTPQNFIDINSFSSSDETFPYVPPEATTPEPETDSCPPGYYFDDTLQQCLPQSPHSNFLGEQDGGQDRPPVKIAGTNRTTTDNNFMATDAEYAAMTPQDLIENYKQRGLVEKDENDNIVIDLSKQLGAKIIDAGLSRIGQGGEADARQKKDFSRLLEKGLVHSKDNKGNYINTDLLNFMPQANLQDPEKTLTAENFPMSKLNEGENYKITIPTTRTDTIITNTNTGFTPGWGNLTYDMSLHTIDPITKKYELNPNSWENYMNEMAKVQTSVTSPVVTLTSPKQISAYTGGVDYDEQSALLDNQVKEEKINQEKEKTEQQKIKTQQVKDEYKDKGQVTYSTKDTGGYVTTPNQPSAPPGEKGGGGYTKPEPKKETKQRDYTKHHAYGL